MVTEIESKVMAAKKASIILSSIRTGEKDKALEAIARALDNNRSSILQANEKDLENAEQLKREGKLSQALVDRLKVNDKKIDSMISGIRDVMTLDDPSGKTISSIELSEGLNLCKVTCPIGLIGVVFESRPDVVPQIMSLCLKSGNAVIFKGGSEALYSNKALFDVMIEALRNTGTIPYDAFHLMETREEVMDILRMDQYIDLLIPRGSNDFVRFIQDNTRIPVLGHADGICHVYVDEAADLDKAYNVCFDSKVQYPAVCNAMETMLVDHTVASRFLPEMAQRYMEAGVELRCDDESFSILENIKGLKLKRASEDDWKSEYNDLILSVKLTNSMAEAIDHINSYGSHHTDAIVTEDEQKKAEFISLVDSSSTIINASTRFADGYRYGKGAEVGISTNKIHARGPVGMEGLVIYKYVLIGNGDTVADFENTGKKKYTHRKLDISLENMLNLKTDKKVM
ncbi:glutamate-5-semialdehyde dehydrogenase [Methanosalsum zhilinae]|nr:glutamate-5-semialdehyde dehydrogenase [Methanosalsum zhilinae]